jgi:hypothetical protein
MEHTVRWLEVIRYDAGEVDAWAAHVFGTEAMGVPVVTIHKANTGGKVFVRLV